MGLYPFQALKLVHFSNSGLLGRTIVVAQDNALAGFHLAALHSAHANTAYIIIVINIGKQNLQRSVQFSLRGGHIFQNSLKQRGHILAGHSRIRGSVAVSAGGVNHRKLQLVIIRAQLNKQIQHLIHHFGRPGAGTVDLIHHNHRPLSQAKSLFQHKPGLGHTALKSVHQQQNAIHHHQDPLYLAAKIGVTGSIHNINFRILIHDRRIFRKNGNPALPLQIIGIHYPFRHRLVRPENTALPQHLIHQGGFAVVYVGDNGNIPQILSYIHSSLPLFPVTCFHFLFSSILHFIISQGAGLVQ